MNVWLQPLGPCMTSPRKRRPGARGRRAAMMGGLGGATRRAVSESGPRQPRPGSVLAGLAGRGRRPRTVSDIDRAAPSVQPFGAHSASQPALQGRLASPKGASGSNERPSAVPLPFRGLGPSGCNDSAVPLPHSSDLSRYSAPWRQMSSAFCTSCGGSGDSGSINEGNRRWTLCYNHSARV